MGKAGKRILASVREARAIARGEMTEGFAVHVPDIVDVRAIREGLDLTREEFSFRFGFAISSLKEWETGRRAPDRSARILLKVIERNPKAVQNALAA